MKEQLINSLNGYYRHLRESAERARSRGGPEAMKIGSQAKLIKQAIEYIEAH